MRPPGEGIRRILSRPSHRRLDGSSLGSSRDFVLLVSESLRNEARIPPASSWWTSPRHAAFSVSTFSAGPARRLSARAAAASARTRATSRSRPSITAGWFHRLFHAGVRAVDIRDPYRPVEVAYFVPAVTAATAPRCVRWTAGSLQVAIQTNNVGWMIAASSTSRPRGPPACHRRAERSGAGSRGCP